MPAHEPVGLRQEPEAVERIDVVQSQALSAEPDRPFEMGHGPCIQAHALVRPTDRQAEGGLHQGLVAKAVADPRRRAVQGFLHGQVRVGLEETVCVLT